MDNLLALLGRFHPVLVHLPIGFLILGILMIFYPGKKRIQLMPAIKLSFFWGSMAAMFSLVTGLILFLKEGYTFETVGSHLILGILTTIAALCLYFYFFQKNKDIDGKVKVFSSCLLLLLMVTGHKGGELTHGETYFTELLPDKVQQLLGTSNSFQEVQIELDRDKWGEALFYKEVIHPILNQNCNSCHNEKNKKGGLVLSSPEMIGKGGKQGAVLIQSDPGKSTLVSKMLLPLDHKEHMPPKGKRQPSVHEIALIRKWVESGASFDMPLAVAGVGEEMISMYFPGEKEEFYPTKEMPQINTKALDQLKNAGFLVEHISLNSPFLKISAINFPKGQVLDWELLHAIAPYIVTLDLSGTAVDDDLWDKVDILEYLTILKLNNSKVEGKGIGVLNSLKNLKRLYLNHSSIQLEPLKSLSEHPSLLSIYFYETPAAKISANEHLRFFAKLEYGNYALPFLPSDEVEY
jgi:uncharacterized membrane protein